MWTRSVLKSNAKQELRFSYWLSFAVCLVAGILGGGSSAGSSNGFTNSMSGTGGQSIAGALRDNGIDMRMVSAIIAFVAASVLFIMLFAIAFSIFVSGPLIVGKCSFFIRAPYGDREFKHLFSSFTSKRYLPIVKTMFFTNLYIFLWSLLFIIPGIIKSYQYRMVPYIISENPHLSSNEAMRISTSMTNGEKLNIWVLDLSFIGWYLLGTLALFVGVLFVTPYAEATYAQLYFALRQRMVPPQTQSW